MMHKHLLYTVTFFVFTFFNSIYTIGATKDESKTLKQIIDNIEAVNANSEHKIYTHVSVRKIYSENGYRLLWTSNIEINEFLKEIEHADYEGLNPDDYHLSALKRMQLSDETSDEFLIERDLMLTDAFLLYASHLLSGKVNPVTIDANWHVTRNEGDPVALFNSTIRSNNYNQAIRDLIPRNTYYLGLKKALNDYKTIQKKGGWHEINKGLDIKPGMSDSRIPDIRRRLGVGLDSEKFHSADTSKLYDKKLFKAVVNFQRSHGFSGDGIIDDPTIKTFNIPIEKRIKQIETNMERWRWLPQNLSNYYILVNIANYELQIIRNGVIERTHKIIAGKPVRKTPVFSSKVKYLVFNPTWTVPPTILVNDVIPETKKSYEYLSNKKIKVFDAKGNQLKIDTINWSSKRVLSYNYVQDPGSHNALGAVKFMFPNTFNVYLHDTPSKELFSKTNRAFSSGCIRVQEPLKLAEYLLNDTVKWNAEKIKATVEANITQAVNLKEMPNVHILYLTTFISDERVAFRKDIYERDESLFAALKEKPILE